MDNKKIAEERMELLFEEAEKKFEEDSVLSQKYIEIAQKIGERVQVSMPPKLQKKLCSNCGSFLKPGRNCLVRINSKRNAIEYRCKECGEVERYGYR